MTGNTLMFLPIIYTRLLDSSRWQITTSWFYLVLRLDPQIVKDACSTLMVLVIRLDFQMVQDVRYHLTCFIQYLDQIFRQLKIAGNNLVVVSSTQTGHSDSPRWQVRLQWFYLVFRLDFQIYFKMSGSSLLVVSNIQTRYSVCSR